MPEYSVACWKCSFREELLLVNFDSLLMYLRMKKCPRCESKLERLPTSASIRIQGGTPNFGATDYGRKK